MSSSSENKKEIVNQLYLELSRTTTSLVNYRKEFISRLNRVSIYICIYLFFTIIIGISHFLDKALFLIASLLFFSLISILLHALLFPQLKKYQQETAKGDSIFAKLSDLLDWEFYRKNQLYNDIDLKYQKLFFNYYSETRGQKSLAGKRNRLFLLILFLLNIVVLFTFTSSIYLFFNWS